LLLHRDVAVVTAAIAAFAATSDAVVAAAVVSVGSIAAVSVCEQSSVPLELQDEVTISLSISC